MIIYKVMNKINNRMYIGQTTRTLDERQRDHFADVRRGSATYFHNALRKYGAENFDWSVIDEAANEQELNEKERYWISFYKSCAYNIAKGGDGGSGPKTEETRRKMSASRKGIVYSEETRRKLRIANTGKVRSAEMNQKNRERQLGKVLSEETRQKMSASRLGKHHSEETKRKIAESHKKKEMA